MSAQDSPVVTQSEVFGFTAKVINGDIYLTNNGKQYRSMLKKFEEQFMRKNEKRTIDECENSDDDKFQAGLDSHLAKAELDIFIVVDGLDQLHMDDQRHFVNGLDVLVREHRKDANQCHLAVAISARDGFGDVKLMSHVLKQIWVKPEDNAKDVHGCLGKYLDSDVFQEQRKDQNGSSECFGRSGRWNYESSVRPALTTLTPPEEMDRIYEDYVKDFDFEPPDRDPKEQQITTRTTALLAQTTGSMPIKVLLEALTFNTTDGRLD
ncbi:hypothetical protein JOL62DRAFT_610528 [Phyllosticta paracitricarpa]|uniref:Uncharacterized protein n=2 Tax=Phyllosticta TaxID=121621 RepID=A0ABR1MJ19_9PEZI